MKERTNEPTNQPTKSGVPRRGLGELEPLPLAYDLRNKRFQMRQNMVFSTKKYQIFSGKGAQPPLPDPFPSGEGVHHCQPTTQ